MLRSLWRALPACLFRCDKSGPRHARELSIDGMCGHLRFAGHDLIADARH
jgi:hypothetical protein